MLFRSNALNSTSYTPVGDLTVVALCLIILVLLAQTYIRKDKKLKLMLGMLVSMIIAALMNVSFQMLIHSEFVLKFSYLIYGVRLLHNVSVVSYMYLYISYLWIPLWVDSKSVMFFRHMTVGLVIAAMMLDILGSFMDYSFKILPDGTVKSGFNMFIPLYLLFILGTLHTIIHYRDRLIKQVFRGLVGVNLISWLVMAIQGPHRQQSFTNAAYFFLLIGIFFMFHSNPYDIDTGAVSISYFANELEETFNKDRRLLIMTCLMVGFNKQIKESMELKMEFFDFFRKNVRRGVLYRSSADRLILTIPISEHRDHNFAVEKMLSDFGRKQKKFNMDYKILICEVSKKMTNPSDYLRLIEFVENDTAFNNIRTVTEEDIDRFFDSRFIINQLDEIVAAHDLDDKRVLLYLQPVYNITKGTYDTAEALMRLKLDKIGMVFPDKFISLAEQYGQIHALSMIILNKTCRILKQFEEEGLDIKRISVNFSAIDLKYDSFCKEVREIITMNGIPFEKIAVEITESRSEQDFNLMKKRILELQSLGIKFYLDDFGTGYSNFERIMELPFDIIKFDRSMLIEMSKNYSSEFMVSTFAGMFIKLGYAVLFEGVENETDERNCVRMNAGYLQGYKYSKPIPAPDVRTFLVPVSAG